MGDFLGFSAPGILVSKNNNDIQEQPLRIFAKFVALVCSLL